MESESGYLPDFSSRYFTADFPFGLSIIKQIMDFVEFDGEKIGETLRWYYEVTGNSIIEFKYSDYGINCYEDFCKFYTK